MNTPPKLDWTACSDDPNNPVAKEQARRYLRAVRRVNTDQDLMSFVLACMQGKRVLDIGVVSHASRYLDQPGWRHGKVRDAASYCLGLDILAPLVDELNARGYNIRCIDATSSEDLGERFDVVFIGDVVEHVHHPVGLLQFAARHLSPGGRILTTTPNPFSRKFFRQFRRDGVMVVNLDHVGWITPTMAMELGRRAGLQLVAYHLVKRISPTTRFIKRLTWRLEPVEYSFPDFLYELAPQD